MDDAQDFTVAETVSETAEEVFQRLARLAPVDYDRVRQSQAEALGCRVTTLDSQVKAARGEADGATGRGVTLPTPDPWPGPVVLSDVLAEVVAAIRRHVILPRKPPTQLPFGWSILGHLSASTIRPGSPLPAHPASVENPSSWRCCASYAVAH